MDKKTENELKKEGLKLLSEAIALVSKAVASVDCETKETKEEVKKDGS